MVETRSQKQGRPLLKPGAYNTDLYYQEKDQGFGDVGVDQEPDTGAVDTRAEDPDFSVTRADEEYASNVQNFEDVDADDRELKADLKDLQDNTPREDVPTLDERGEPVPVVEGDLEEQEAADNTYTTT